MTSQEYADCLLKHWQLLWPLPAAARIERINAIAADLEFEDQLRLVTTAMQERQPASLPKRCLDMQAVWGWAVAASLNLGGFAVLAVIGYTVFRP